MGGLMPTTRHKLAGGGGLMPTTRPQFGLERAQIATTRITRNITRLQDCPGTLGGILQPPARLQDGLAILRARKIPRLQDCPGTLGGILRVVPCPRGPTTRKMAPRLPGNLAVLQSCGPARLQGSIAILRVVMFGLMCFFLAGDAVQLVPLER